MIFPGSPFSTFPRNYYPTKNSYRYSRPISYYNGHIYSNCDTVEEKNINKKFEEFSVKNDTSSRISKDDDNIFFEIFGLKLYFDDILLICMIFFLYSEGVQDEMLFISLILLLIS